MKIFSYDDAGESRLAVAIDAQYYLPLSAVDPDLPHDMIELLELEDGLARVRAAARSRDGALPLEGVVMKPFLARPNALWALALNFKSHIQETGLTTSPLYPHAFLRTPASYVGHLQPIVAPPTDMARAFDYEGELGVVIGRGGRHIPIERALDHVAGYTCVNEGSVREYQAHNRQFGLGKNFEASGSYGPWLVTADEFGDPATHTVKTRINGRVRQCAPLNDMLFTVPQVVSYLSQGYELRPGDMIAMGTPGALKPQSDDVEGLDLSRQYGQFLTPGLVHMRPDDVIEIEIDRLGILRNRVIADLPREYRA